MFSCGMKSAICPYTRPSFSISTTTASPPSPVFPTRTPERAKPRYLTSAEKQDPDTVIIPRYWVPESEVLERVGRSVGRSVGRTDGRTDGRTTNPIIAAGHDLSARRPGYQLACRKITNATNERTGVFGVIPIAGLSDSATTLLPGWSSSEILQARPTSEPRSAWLYR